MLRYKFHLYRGGAEIHANLLYQELKKRGHKVDMIKLPFKDYPNNKLIESMYMGRALDLTESFGDRIDMVIAMKFPAIYCKANKKVLWLLHQHRQAYDMYDTEWGLSHTPDGEKVRQLIVNSDNKYISEAEHIFTNAQNTANRLKKYNDIDATALYSPPENYDKLYCGDFSDYVFYPSRINPIKRQILVVEALKYTKTPVKVVLAGSSEQGELEKIKKIIFENNLEDRVNLAGFISEKEKQDFYANCLGVYFGAYDEDYGYITLEGFFSHKPVIVHTDAGGPLEFVEDQYNGFVTKPDPEAIAEKLDELYLNKEKAKEMGEAGYQTLLDKHIDWDYAIDQLLS